MAQLIQNGDNNIGAKLMKVHIGFKSAVFKYGTINQIRQMKPVFFDRHMFCNNNEVVDQMMNDLSNESVSIIDALVLHKTNSLSHLTSLKKHVELDAATKLHFIQKQMAYQNIEGFKLMTQDFDLTQSYIGRWNPDFCFCDTDDDRIGKQIDLLTEAVDRDCLEIASYLIPHFSVEQIQAAHDHLVMVQKVSRYHQSWDPPLTLLNREALARLLLDHGAKACKDVEKTP